MAIVNDKKEIGTGKIILIVVTVFTVIPIMIMSMLYFFSNDFQYTANNLLSTLPGAVGQYFDQFPTKEEREEQKKEVAQYLIDIDTASATDKLMIIENSDPALYSDIIGIMSGLNSKQTEKVLEGVRKSSIKKDVLVSTISQIKSDEILRLRDRAQYYEEKNLVDAVTEIDTLLRSEKTTYKEMADIMAQMDEENASKILSKLEPDISNKIITSFESDIKKMALDKLVNDIKAREKQLMDVAIIYDVENSDKILEDLGTNEKYSMNELSIIYRNMDKVKASEVLSQVEDKNFVYHLLEQIRSDEVLEKGADLLTPELIYGTSIFEEYNRKVSEFVGIASKMESDQILEMINELYNSTNASKTYAINEEDNITISDKDLAIRILSELKSTVGAEVLSQMEPTMASEISKRISLPNN